MSVSGRWHRRHTYKISKFHTEGEQIWAVCVDRYLDHMLGADWNTAPYWPSADTQMMEFLRTVITDYTNDAGRWPSQNEFWAYYHSAIHHQHIMKHERSMFHNSLTQSGRSPLDGAVES